jgi:hypothetical protein
MDAILSHSQIAIGAVTMTSRKWSRWILLALADQNAQALALAAQIHRENFAAKVGVAARNAADRDVAFGLDGDGRAAPGWLPLEQARKQGRAH